MLRHRSARDESMIGDPHRLSLTRRRVLLGVAAIAANALATACGGGSSATDTPKAVVPTAAATAIPATAPPIPPTVAPPIPPTTPPTVAATPAAAASLSVPTVGASLATMTTAPTMPLLVFAGAGLTVGSGVLPSQTYPAQTVALLVPARYDAVNLGGMGKEWTIAKMNDLAPTDIDPLYAASRSKNIVVLFDVHNDFVWDHTSAEETFARLVTFCQARRKVGFKVVIGTLPPSTLLGLPPQAIQAYEPLRQDVNRLIRKNLASFADALADVGADPTIGAAGASENPDYFQYDGFRLTAKGYGIVAGIVKAAILTL